MHAHKPEAQWNYSQFWHRRMWIWYSYKALYYFNSKCIFTEIVYHDIQFVCHTAERPSFYIGKGVFDAVYYVGNYDINDTIIEKVNLCKIGVQ